MGRGLRIVCWLCFLLGISISLTTSHNGESSNLPDRDSPPKRNVLDCAFLGNKNSKEQSLLREDDCGDGRRVPCTRPRWNGDSKNAASFRARGRGWHPCL